MHLGLRYHRLVNFCAKEVLLLHYPETSPMGCLLTAGLNMIKFCLLGQLDLSSQPRTHHSHHLGHFFAGTISNQSKLSGKTNHLLAGQPISNALLILWKTHVSANRRVTNCGEVLTRVIRLMAILLCFLEPFVLSLLLYLGLWNGFLVPILVEIAVANI